MPNFTVVVHEILFGQSCGGHYSTPSRVPNWIFEEGGIGREKEEKKQKEGKWKRGRRVGRDVEERLQYKIAILHGGIARSPQVIE